MDWFAQIDAYCERTDSGLWSEPVNAITNLAFILAAVLMWRRGGGVGFARPLAAVLFMIGIGSGLFHTLAVRWAAAADTLPILIFILLYVLAVNRGVLGWRWAWAVAGSLGFVPWAAALAPAFGALPFFEVSAAYWPVPALIALYAVALRRRMPRFARDLGIGAGILVVSLTFRSLDMATCAALPLGTHFMWHILNALMLGWMIGALIRRAADLRLAGQGPGR